MDEKETLQRKFTLKKQGLQLIRNEIKELRQRLFLLELRDYYSSKIEKDFDRKLSLKIDAVNALLDMA